MLEIKKAQKLILERIKETEVQKINLKDALGYSLFQDIFSPLPVPLFDNSAMDGYAVRFKDVELATKKNPVRLKIIEEIPAGHFPKRRVRSGQASLIMTGAMVPLGADAVVIIEETKQTGNCVEIYNSVKKGENIRCRGEVIKQGKRLLKKHTRLRPQELALLATVNIPKVRVYRKPMVAVLSTGSEVVALGRRLKPGQIVDSNRYGVMAQVKSLGIPVLDLGIAGDTEKLIEKKIKEGIRSADILLTIGGVSVGKWDLVKKVVERLGKVIFWKINMKPGGPTTFGKISGKLWFGLPGNPVASLVSFDQMVKPAILKMLGDKNIFPPTFSAVLEKDYIGRAGKVRLERVFIKSKGGKFFADPVRSLGSGDMCSMTQANGVMVVGENISYLKAGSRVRAQFL